ncbi:MAG TPA: DUF3365 domain-containing protein [Stenomitos sp.]
MFGKHRLGTQFTVLLALVFAGGMLLSGIALSSTLQKEAEEDITLRAELLMQTMDAVRDYTSQHIEPLLASQLTPTAPFTPESVPAYSAREVFEQFRDHPDYRNFFYKEATLNPTNPRDRADDFEADFIRQFQQNPQRNQLYGYRTVNGRKLFYIAQPLAVQQQSCLRCHSQPALAPQSLIARYGSTGGFGWHLNDIVAAQTVYVPADEVFDHGRQSFILVMGIFSVVFALAVGLINRLLRQRVIRPLNLLTKLASTFANASSQRQANPVPAAATTLAALKGPQLSAIASRPDEPGQLTRAFQQMAQEVEAREQILAQAVTQRTAQLAKSTKEAEAAKAKAEAANRTKSQFLSHMSHELRTPLNIILGFAQLMERSSSLTPPQQGYLETIGRSGEHLLALINDVLEISKIEAGRTELHITAFDFSGLLDGLQQMFQVKAEAKGLILELQRAPNLPTHICTDEGKLRQVLLNLLGNAIKFTQQGRVCLQVEAAALEPNHTHTVRLQFTVQDTGPGISAQELQTLFDPFVQAEAGQKAQEGTGLGLPISREFVHLMGGDMQVESRIGGGSTFQFQIPVQVVEAAVDFAIAPQRQILSLASGQPQYRILIAEDKPENRQLLRELLVPVGFEVQEASDGAAAITLCDRWMPHLIWMDMRMPVVDGYEATQYIKHMKTTVGSAPPVIIALSSSAFEEDRTVALAAGCDDFVRKPFRSETIFAKIAEHLGAQYNFVPDSTPTSEEFGQETVANSTLADPLRVAADHLAAMPLDWIAQLHATARKADGKAIGRLLEHIPATQLPLVQALETLVHQFCFEEIAAVSAPYLLHQEQ